MVLIYGSSGPIKQYHTAHSSPIRGNSLVTESIYGIESSSSNLPPVKLTSLAVIKPIKYRIHLLTAVITLLMVHLYQEKISLE